VSVPVGPAFQARLWDQRIARARSLAGNSSPASAILTFYAELALYQRNLAGSMPLDRLKALDPSDPLAAVDPAAVALPKVLEWLQRHAPPVLAQAAAEGATLAMEEWRRLLEQRLADGRLGTDGPAAFVVEAVLQPFVNVVRLTADAAGGVRLKADTTQATRCPICASSPVAAALREEGHGARRSLVCSLCFTEWDYLRIQCPACEENRFDALPVYTADAPAAVRIDACDSCRTYIKTIDLTRDGLAVPTVDDLASLPLDLWARERGYHRLYPNLLRI
jgi:FdhE protein